MTRSSPRSALSRLDLPTFGRPTNAIAAGSCSDSAAIAASQRAASGSTAVEIDVGLDVVTVGLVGIGVAHDIRFEPPGGDLIGPGVGLDLARLAGELLLALGRQRPDDRIEQVAGPAPVGRGDRVGLVPAEGVELGPFELALLVVGLVDRDDDRGLGAAQDVGRLLVGRGQPDDGVHHQHDDVRLRDGQPGLVLDGGLDQVVGVELEAARVDQDEAPSVPLGVAVEAIAGRVGAILDDGRAAADDPVEERALADVRPADDGDDREPARMCGHRVRRRRTC